MAHNNSYPELYVAHRLSAEHDFNHYFVFYVLIILHKLFLTPYVFIFKIHKNVKMWRLKNGSLGKQS